jgi:hypothetical protein
MTYFFMGHGPQGMIANCIREGECVPLFPEVCLGNKTSQVLGRVFGGELKDVRFGEN